MQNQVWCMSGLMRHGMAKCNKQHYKLSGAQYANFEIGPDLNKPYVQVVKQQVKMHQINLMKF